MPLDCHINLRAALYSPENRSQIKRAKPTRLSSLSVSITSCWNNQRSLGCRLKLKTEQRVRIVHMLLEVSLIVEEPLNVNCRLINDHACDLCSILVTENALNHGVHRIADHVATLVTADLFKGVDVDHCRCRNLDHRWRLLCRHSIGSSVSTHSHGRSGLRHGVSRSWHRVRLHLLVAGLG